MNVSTALVFIHPAAPSAAQSRSDIGIDKVKVPLFFPTINPCGKTKCRQQHGMNEPTDIRTVIAFRKKYQ